ncbi:Inhibitor of nuclear factor kappaB kinase subunit epsilonlike [Caligus rogercresseyi]|uniref:Inhibitor of nuclear factor kappaB kinase subunit epsilonlike n=1 Tax=Caligus rogercresseyi TaxID=217165 RepID=A0A7T8KJU4_CALRO|nr:Inhibitor of nuclear factor kappaB kinase subunit epsilonlike [Caligus rogercresseyi]
MLQGGSLFNLLDDPENSYGLEEDEWLLVLSHLSAGMNHLRDNNLVHRDLKPGNIMKFIKDDGSIVYKLTDFGAARELEDDQQFVSLYGTEEYLHPDMYERAVLRKTVGKTFGATVDLWSIGVTLYHVATGNLPFRPFGGRRNKETMYHITTKKSSGVISGVQTSENGPIQWGRELPSTCLLSAGIKKHITPLLAGLLEVNPQKRWTFERFFSQVTWILEKKKLHVYFMNKLTPHRVYLDKTEGFDAFKKILSEQTEISPENDMIILFGENELSHYVSDSTPGTDFPDTSPSRPIVLFNKNNNNISIGLDKENDATLAKSACSVGYSYRRKIDSYTQCLKIMNSAIEMLSEVVKIRLSELLEASQACSRLTKLIENQIHFFVSTHEINVKLSKESFSSSKSHPRDEEDSSYQSLQSLVLDEEEGLKNLKNQFGELSPAVEQLNRRFVREDQLKKEWEEVMRDFPRGVTSAGSKAHTYVAKLKESWQHLLRDRASRTLTYNDEQFHILEKIKMQETIKVLVELLSKECEPALVNQSEGLADWYKMAQTTFIQAEILLKDIGVFKENTRHFSESLKISQDRYLEKMASLVEEAENLKMDTIKKEEIESCKNKMESRQIKMAIKSILSTQDEVWGILRENTRLIEQFGELASLADASPSSENNTAEILAKIEQLSS